MKINYIKLFLNCMILFPIVAILTSQAASSKKMHDVVDFAKILHNAVNPQRLEVSLIVKSRNRNSSLHLKLPAHSKNIAFLREDNNSKKPVVFLIHGFLNSGREKWLKRLAKAYLKQKDATIFIVDWGSGALTADYHAAKKKAHLVAVEITDFIKLLIEKAKVKSSQIHMIGHSLGAHIAGFVGKHIKGIDRITGLDPASPEFSSSSSDGSFGAQMVKFSSKHLSKLNTASESALTAPPHHPIRVMRVEICRGLGRNGIRFVRKCLSKIGTDSSEAACHGLECQIGRLVEKHVSNQIEKRSSEQLDPSPSNSIISKFVPQLASSIFKFVGQQLASDSYESYPEAYYASHEQKYSPDFSRLSNKDANHVDVIHTSNDFGTYDRLGHLDFYVNGGMSQPGCRDFNNKGEDLVDSFFNVVCSHTRAVEYFIESIQRPQNFFVASNTPHRAESVRSLDFDPRVDTVLGLEAFHYSSHGVYHVVTNSIPPYCRT